MEIKSENISKFLIDGHVHFYNIFNPDSFFENTFKNFHRFFPNDDYTESGIVKMLFFTEGKDNDFFSKLSRNSVKLDKQRYKITKTGEDISIKVTDTKNKNDAIYIIRGRQIVTEENIEILHIGTDTTIKDGLPAKKVLEMIEERDEISVIAWGVGKWSFKRKRVVKTLIDSINSTMNFIGDNSARPSFWRRPGLFRYGKQKGFKLLNGSDPLPIADEEKKTGSYFFYVEGEFNVEKPFQSVKNLLASSSQKIVFYGKRDSLLSFFHRQIKIQLKKHMN